MPYPDRCASRAVVARGSGPACAGVIAVPKSSCCASQGAVAAVAAVAAASAGCPGAGVATRWKLKKFGRENYNNQ